jgi:hypothetical protein
MGSKSATGNGRWSCVRVERWIHRLFLHAGGPPVLDPSLGRAGRWIVRIYLYRKERSVMDLERAVIAGLFLVLGVILGALMWWLGPWTWLVGFGAVLTVLCSLALLGMAIVALTSRELVRRRRVIDTYYWANSQYDLVQAFHEPPPVSERAFPRARTPRGRWSSGESPPDTLRDAYRQSRQVAEEAVLAAECSDGLVDSAEVARLMQNELWRLALAGERLAQQRLKADGVPRGLPRNEPLRAADDAMREIAAIRRGLVDARNAIRAVAAQVAARKVATPEERVPTASEALAERVRALEHGLRRIHGEPPQDSPSGAPPTGADGSPR